AFECDHVVSDPQGPLGACRSANHWTYGAESALTDGADGRLARSPIAACQANGALARRLVFRLGTASATFYLAAGGTRDEAYGLLRAARARGTSPEAQRAATEAWWASYLAPAHLPDTDDAAVQAFAKRSLIVMRTATDAASGAIVASIDSEPPYGEDWPRDGSFINYALDLAGYPDVVSRHNRFYARVQRKTPAPWSILYSFPPCDTAHPVYPNCVPAGTYETNYYADPAAIVLLALRDAVAAAGACGFDPARVAGWDARASELEQAIHDNFFVASAPAHYEGGRPAWLLWPVGFFASGDPVALSHAEYLKA